jgi:hypothetical protein
VSVPYSPEDLTWLLTEWQATTASGGEYMTWRRLVGRYPGKSNLEWLWGLIDAEVAHGYLVPVEGFDSPPGPDTQVTWDRWQLTDTGRQLVGPGATAG